MNTFEFEGKTYKAIPDRDMCSGCAFQGKANICNRVWMEAVDAEVVDCVDGFIYILAEDKQSKIEKAKAALKAAMDALDALEQDE